MVFDFPPGSGWNPLKLGGTRALSVQLRSASQAAALSTSREMVSRPRPGSKGASLKANAIQALQRFPLKVAVTAGCLALTGDTIAQSVERYKKRHSLEEAEGLSEEDRQELSKGSRPLDHDYARALRMGSYGFLLYAPGTHVWYHALDRLLVGKSLQNVSLKVLANQVVLGPTILLVVFAWNFMWMGKIKELPAKYRKDMAPSIINSWKFWLPATCLNFGVVPLNCRVAFMSSCGVFWNYYLSTSVGKK